MNSLMKLTSRVAGSLLALTFVLSGASAGTQEFGQNLGEPTEPQFCLQNFNAYGPVYASGIASRTERLTKTLRKEACAAVHLQEVWNTSQIDQVWNSLFNDYSMSTPNRKAKIGIMSLFKGAILEHKTYAFRVNNEGGLLDGIRQMFNVKKAFHVVRTRLHDMGEDFYFINTHLHPASEAVRITQILDIFNWRMYNQDSKLLMSGDFNADVNSIERELIMRLMGLHDAMGEHLGSYSGVCTYCDRNPLSWLKGNHVFDYVFFSNVGDAETSLRVVDGKINLRGTSESPLSDHFGVKIQFALSTVKPDRDYLAEEMDRAATLKVLKRAQFALVLENDEDLLPYKQEIRDLIEQLETKTGFFAEYLHRSI